MNHDDHGAPAEHDAPQVTPFVIARFWAGLIAGCALVIPATLVALALIPTLLGLTSATVVGSGSMTPALRVGDVVVLEPVRDRGRGLNPPSVVLVERPDGSTPLLHRITGPAPDNSGYTTRGDANPTDDTDPAPYADVRGVGRVAIPVIGIPLVWLHEGRLLAVALLLAAITATTTLARYGWSTRHDPFHHPEQLDDAEQPQPTLPNEIPLHHLPGLATTTATAALLRAGPRHTTHHTRLPHHLPALHRPRTITTALVIAALATTLPTTLPLADAAYTGTTTNPANQLTADTLAPPTNVTATTTCTPGSAGAEIVHSQVTLGNTLRLPSTVQADDVLIAHIVTTGSSPGGPGLWAYLDQQPAPGSSLKVFLSQKKATNTDAGATYTWSSSANDISIGLVVVRGATPATTAEAAGALANSTTSTAPSVTPGSVPALLVTFHAAGGGAVLTPPPGMTQRYDETRFTNTRSAAYTQPVTAAGPTGERTATLDTAAENGAQSVVLATSGSATPSTAVVDLAWTATTATYATGYEVLRDGSVLATVTGRAATTFTDTTPGTGPRTYSVRSRAGGWSSTPATSPSITPTCP